jgi:hypothetical protein
MGAHKAMRGGDLPLLDLVSLSYCRTRSCRPLLLPAAVVTWPLTLSSHARPPSSPSHRSPTSGHRPTSPPSHWSPTLDPHDANARPPWPPSPLGRRCPYRRWGPTTTVPTVGEEPATVFLLCAFVHIVVLKCTVVVYLFVLNPLFFLS